MERCYILIWSLLACRRRMCAGQRATDQSWQHCAGDEILAADPLRIPALTLLFEAASRPQESFDAKSSPFSEHPTKLQRKSDIFGRLLEELRGMVLTLLTSKDVANLRRASRTFRHLINTLW